MKIYSKITALLLSGLLLFCSCSDFLELTPSDAVDADNAVTDAKSAQVALNGVYRYMSGYNYYGLLFLFYADMKGGDFFPPALGRGQDAYYTFTHESNTSTGEGMWTQIYSGLSQLNNLISNLEKLDTNGMTTSDISAITHIKGQAYALRSLFHFDLVRLYGYPYTMDQGASLGVAIVTKPLLPSEQLGRNTVKEVYDQIEADLTASLQFLKKTKSAGYLNYYGAEAILARVNLFKGNFDKAGDYAKDIIDNGGYSLYSNTEWVASWKAQFGKESIFELTVSPNENDQALSGPGNFLRPKYIAGTALAAYTAGDYFLNDRLGEDPEDIRWGVMGEDEYADDGSIPGRRGWIKKYEGDGKATVSANNIKVIRLSEIYLIAAEASARKSTPDLNAAATYLNAIRKRSPNLLPASAADGADKLVDLVFLERSKELLAEGHRFFDMMRDNRSITFDESKDFVIPANGRAQTIDRSYYKIVLPISRTEMLANPVIREQQNPGY